MGDEVQRASWLLVVLLVTGMLTGCGATAGVVGQQETSSPDSSGAVQVPTAPSRTPTAVPTVTPELASRPTATETATPAWTSQPTATTGPTPEMSTASPSPAPRLADTATRAVTATQTATPVVPEITGPEDAGDQEAVADGLLVYKDQYCGVCHQFGAAGTGGLFGPTHDGMGVTAAERIQDPGYAGAATTSAEYLRESIVDPQAYVVPGYEATSHSMPAYGYLSEQEIMALVQLLAGQE